MIPLVYNVISEDSTDGVLLASFYPEGLGKQRAREDADKYAAQYPGSIVCPQYYIAASS